MLRNIGYRGALLLAVLALSVAPSRQAAAADQTAHLRKTPAVLPNAGQYIDLQTGELTYANARALIQATFPGANADSPDFYCVIHTVRWGDDGPVVDKNHWYVYRGGGSPASYGGRWTAARFAGTRIFGTDRLSMLYVHVNVPSLPKAAVAASVAAQIATHNAFVAANPGSGDPHTASEFLTAAGDPRDKLTSTADRALRVVGNTVVETAYTNIAYQIDVVKKLPAPIQNLEAIIGLAQGDVAPGVRLALTERAALYAGDTFDIRHVPSDVTVTGFQTLRPGIDKPTELGKQLFDNEGLYFWDVSIGIPVTSVNQLNFETSDGQIFAKSVDKAQLLALLNVFWPATDTKSTHLSLVPRFVVGVAASKKPLDKVLVGAAIGLNRVQVYGGRQWTMTDQQPAADADPAAPAAKAKHEPSWVAGINVPVRQVVDFLKAKK